MLLNYMRIKYAVYQRKVKFGLKCGLKERGRQKLLL